MMKIKKNIWAKLFFLSIWSAFVLYTVYIEKQIDSLGTIAIVVSWLSVIFVILAYITGKK